MISIFFVFLIKGIRRLKMYVIRPLFHTYGKNFIFDPNSIFSYATISIGNDVYIGSNACFLASESKILIGNKVMFGPNVTIMGGDHNTSTIGIYMFDQKEKHSENDQPVIIKNDVWVGCNVVILKGVTIYDGSIIAAGSLVNKDVAPYTIVGGVPARKIRDRFDQKEILLHKQMLGL